MVVVARRAFRLLLTELGKAAPGRGSDLDDFIRAFDVSQKSSAN
jgi:hypothetical protein